MQLDVTIHLQSPRWKTLLKPYGKTVRDVCTAAIADTRLGRLRRTFEMAVVLADDKTIRELNRDYRGRDKPTNVLSFPGSEMSEGSLAKGKDSYHIGDVVLALETIEREAKEQGKKPRQHAAHLLVHGTLHLLGYDHEDEDDARIMETKEIKILKKLGFSNPYL